MIGEDILKRLAEDARTSIDSGYYNVSARSNREDRRNLLQSFKKSNHSLMCEIKFASPSAGRISDENHDVAGIATKMERGGADALSVLTERGSFKGSLENLPLAKGATKIPIMMKDIVISEEQIIAGSRIGADAVLLILELYENGLARLSLDKAIALAHECGLSVVVETYSFDGLERLVSHSECDVAGINNRDLTTFKVNVERTIELLKKLGSADFIERPLIMSESGFESAADLKKVLSALKSSDSVLPDAFLIGTSIMKSQNIEEKVKEFSQVLRGQNPF